MGTRIFWNDVQLLRNSCASKPWKSRESAWQPAFNRNCCITCCEALCNSVHAKTRNSLDPCLFWVLRLLLVIFILRDTGIFLNYYRRQGRVEVVRQAACLTLVWSLFRLNVAEGLGREIGDSPGEKRHININFLLWLTPRWHCDKRLVVPGLTGPKSLCVRLQTQEI